MRRVAVEVLHQSRERALPPGGLILPGDLWGREGERTAVRDGPARRHGVCMAAARDGAVSSLRELPLCSSAATLLTRLGGDDTLPPSISLLPASLPSLVRLSYVSPSCLSFFSVGDWWVWSVLVSPWWCYSLVYGACCCCCCVCLV